LQKITLIICLLIISSGCSVNRIRKSSEVETSAIKARGNIADIMKEQNLTNGPFIIQRADIEVIGLDQSEKIITNIKFNSSNEFLISIRGKTGIEIARIFVSSDTILANDRINRKMFCASPEYLKTRYGLSISFLPLLLGDFIGNNLLAKNEKDCYEGFLSNDILVEGVKIRYTVDCDKGKLVSAIGESSLDDVKICFNYSEFFKQNGKWIPGKIEFEDSFRKTKILIEIKKISLPWDGEIEFIPGNRYEINRLI